MSKTVKVNFNENGVGESFGVMEDGWHTNERLILTNGDGMVGESFEPIAKANSVRCAKAHLYDVKDKLCLRSLFGMQHYSDDAFNEALELRWNKLIEEANALDYQDEKQ